MAGPSGCWSWHAVVRAGSGAREGWGAFLRGAGEGRAGPVVGPSLSRPSRQQSRRRRGAGRDPALANGESRRVRGRGLEGE